jgi:GNAT superfamily N-acetyltransferase
MGVHYPSAMAHARISLGWRLHGVLGRGLGRAGIRLFRFFSRPLDAALAPAPPGVRLRTLGEAEVLALCVDATLELSPEKVRRAFARGDACAGAYENDHLAGYCWYAFAPLPHLDDVWVDFARPRSVWLYKSLVRARHRGQGIAPALYRMADRLAVPRGATQALICVESHNGASIAAARRAGFIAAGYAAYRARARAVAAWYSPRARSEGVRFFVKSGTAG